MDRLFNSFSQKKNVGKIIGNILERHYPGDIGEISFEDLLTWDMWQTFIKIHSKYEFVVDEQ